MEHAQDFSVPVGNAGLTHHFSVGGRAMLWNAATGEFAPRVHPALAELLDKPEQEREGVLTLAKAKAELGQEHGLVRLAQRWLDGDGSSERQKFRPRVEPDTFIVFPAAGCNMACTYCINDGGQMSGKNRRGVMSADTAQAFVDWVATYDDGKPRPRTHVTLIGGEPTLAPEACEVLIGGLLALNEQDGVRVSVKLATNGIRCPPGLLDLLQQWPDRTNVGVSLDGGRARNDRWRVDHKGRGTYDRVVDFMRDVQGRGLRYGVTAVLAYPFDYVESYQELRALGASKIELKYSEFTPFNRLDREVPPAEQFETWRSNYLAYNDFILDELERTGGDAPVKTERWNLFRQIFGVFGGDALSCEAGIEALAVSPDGEVYPCDRFFGDESFRLGGVHQEAGRKLEMEAVDRYHQRLTDEGQIVEDSERCSTCIAREVCRGGCYGNNLESNGHIGSVIERNCERRRERLRIDLYYLARLAEEQPAVLAEMGGPSVG